MTDFRLVKSNRPESAVMRRLEADIEHEHSIDCLTTAQESFYDRLDWRTWHGHTAGRNENGLIPTSYRRGIIVLFLSKTPLRDFDSLLPIERPPVHLWQLILRYAKMTESYTTIFETDRLLLRQQVPEDLEGLWEFHCNPENVRYYQDAPNTLDEVREQMEWDLDWYQRNKELGTWAIIHKETGRIVGLCSLMPWTVDGIEEVEMAYILSEDCRGQGLGTELSRAVIQYGFEKLRLPRIISLIEPGNMLSRHVVEKVGMRFEKEGQDEAGPFVVYSIARQ